MLPDFTRIQDISFETALLAGLAAMGICFLLHALRSELRIAALRRDNAELVRSMDSVLRSRPREEHWKPIARNSPKGLESHLASNAILALADPEPSPEPERDRRLAHAVAYAIAEEQLEISLQPIVSISEGKAIAFDVFASVELDGEGRAHSRRFAPCDALDLVEFDVSMFLASVQAARQRLGTASERTKLHLAFSEELLSAPEPMSEICAILAVHPAIVRSIVISLPPAAGHSKELLPAIRRLFDAGLSLALEHGPKRGGDPVGLPPIEYLKIDVDRLLSVAEGAKGSTPDWRAELRTDPGTRVIACGVADEERAARLVDLGIDTMTGSWFSEPRCLHRAEAEPAAAGAD